MPIFHEYVGWFEIPMDDFLAEQVQIPIDQLSDEPKDLMFLQLTLYALAEITITEFSDDVCVVFGVVHLVELEHGGCVA